MLLSAMGEGGFMANLMIRNIDAALKARLRLRAAAHGRSPEDEAHEILRIALSSEPPRPLNPAAAIRARIRPIGGVDLEHAPREPLRPPVDFDS